MRNSLVSYKTPDIRADVNRRVRVVRRKYRHGFWLSLFSFILLAMPKLRFVGSFPIYVIDAVLIILLILSFKRQSINWKPLRPIPKLVVIYIFFVLLGELHGLIVYMCPVESIYLMVRFSLASSLVYILPKLVTTYDDLIPVIKGVIVGILITSVIVIMYSISLTRPLVTSTVFSIDMLEPASQLVIAETMRLGGGEDALRGRSLIGVSTLTTGFIGSMWPLVFLANKLPHFNKRWKRIALLASFVSPVALLMTYGRIAWATVAVVGIMISIFKFSGGRRVFAIMAIGCLLVVNMYGIHSKLFQIERIVNPEPAHYEKAANERILSYIEPFQHLAENPLWLFVGAGEIANTLISRGHGVIELYDREGLATHSAFSMAYYNYGFFAAMCMVLLMLSGFRLILQRIKLRDRRKKEYIWIWQILLTALCGLTPWWLGGHAVVSAPHGAMLFFFLFGLLLAFRRIESLHDMGLSAPRRTYKNYGGSEYHKSSVSLSHRRMR